MKKIIAVLFGFVLLAAPAATQAQFNYITNADNTLTITSYTGTNGIVSIPSTISNLTVSVVGDGDTVFGEYTTNVVIPDTVTQIGEWAFEECYFLTNVTIPNSVSNIGAGAFYYCTNLSGVNIPNGVTAIPYEAFYECYNLTNVMLPPSVKSIGVDAYEYCTNLQNVVIPPTVTSIGEYSFYEAGIVSLTIGTNGATTNARCVIGSYAFEEAYGMSNVFIGTSVSKIGYESFDEASLTNLTIGTNFTSAALGCTIAGDAFYECYSLANATIGSSVTNIGDDAFEEAYVSNLTIGSAVLVPGAGCIIGEDAFDESYLTNLAVGKSVVTIGEDAFDYCYYLSNVTVAGGSIGTYAFYYCTNLQSVTLGTAVTSIGYEAFDDCYRLTNAYIGGGDIGSEAFEEDEMLTNVTFGPNVTSIGNSAFEDCYDLTSVTIPDSVTSLGAYAFEYCHNLTNVIIGAGITKVPYEVFMCCGSLSNVVVGPNVASISADAFENDTYLYGVYFQGGAPLPSSEAFYNDTNVTVYYYGGTGGWYSNYAGFSTVLLSQNSLTVTLGPSSAIAAGAYWQLDGGSVYTASSTTLYNLSPGSHTVTFAAVPGLISPANQTLAVTNAVTIGGIYVPSNAPSSGLIILTNGSGAVTVTGSPKTFTAGKTYKITAVPAANNLFVSWTGGTSQPFAVLSTSAGYSFTFEPNLVLIANFATNPFVAVSGAYNGLFSTTNGVTQGTAGMLSALTISTKGSYSGKLLLNNASYSVTGSFDITGQATNVIARKSTLGGPLVLTMLLSTTDGSTPQITGTVTGTNSGSPFTANLIAYEADNALPSAEYTMLILPVTNGAPSNSPGGDGYVLITNNAGTAKNPGAAAAKITGGLADGTTFSQTVPVSTDGYAPVYASLSGKGLVLGWINLTLTNTSGVGLTWIRDASAKGIYTNGFTNVLTADQLPISQWGSASSVLPTLTNLTVVPVVGATNGTSSAVTITAAGKVTGGATGTIDPKTGLVKLTIGSGASKVTAYGAVLLDSTSAGGYYVTKTNAQGFTLTQ